MHPGPSLPCGRGSCFYARPPPSCRRRASCALTEPHAPLPLSLAAASPRARLPVLTGAGVEWSSVLVYEVGQRGALAGPFEAVAGEPGGGEALARLPEMGYSHLAYVSVK